MSKLRTATLHYLENAIEAVKATEEIHPSHLGILGKYLNSFLKYAQCSEDAAENDFREGLYGELTDEEFESQLVNESEVQQ